MMVMNSRFPCKGKRHNTTSGSCNCMQRRCRSQTERANSIGRRLSLHPRTLAYDQQPYAALRAVSTFVIHVIWITTQLPTPKGWKAELTWLVDPQRTRNPRSGHVSTIDLA